MNEKKSTLIRKAAVRLDISNKAAKMLYTKKCLKVWRSKDTGNALFSMNKEIADSLGLLRKGS